MYVFYNELSTLMCTLCTPWNYFMTDEHFFSHISKVIKFEDYFFDIENNKLFILTINNELYK